MVKYYAERIPDNERDDWNATDYLPHRTKQLTADYSYWLTCYELAKENILDTERLYEKYRMADIYEWYSRRLAYKFRPPKKRG